MSRACRNEYLSAMGIEIWIPRAGAAADVSTSCPPAIAASLVIGPGRGDTLLLCGDPAEAATPLAADIARSLAGEPVWAWPAPDESVPAMPLQQAIEERLFTRVLVFGSGLLAPAMGPPAKVLGSARLIRVDSIPRLLKSGAARRALWLALNEY